MEEQEKSTTETPEEKESIHFLQKLMDNPWLLLALGLIFPIVSYTLWGIIELFGIGPARLP